MSNPPAIESFLKQLSEMQDSLDSFTPAPPSKPPTVPPTANLGDNPDMEARMTRVETKLDHIEKEVSQTKWWLIGSTVTIVLTVVATVIGTGVGIQQMTVATFQAAKESPAPAPAQPPIIINIPTPQAPPGK